MTEAIKDEFVSKEKKNFKLRLGRAIASSLSGFLAGLVVASILFLSFFELTLK